MSDYTDDDPNEELKDMLRQLFGENAGIDAEQLSRMVGQDISPAMLQQIMNQMKEAFSNPDGGISWEAARRQALHIANQDDRGLTTGQKDNLDQAFSLSNLWLTEVTAISELSETPVAITRGQWAEKTLPVWQELAEPVATSMADALTAGLSEHSPEEAQPMVASAGQMMRTVGGSLFATQLGQVVGQLSREVVSAGDVGIPLFPPGQAGVLPQNFADFNAGLGIDDDQCALYLATRELAHARLFRHAKWLREGVIAQVRNFARGTRVNMELFEDIAERFDPSAPDELQQAFESGALLPEKTPEQQQALTRLEDLLATIEGWVDVVTADATTRLPDSDRIAEIVRRRRAVGGPAEKALTSLVGLDLRPRRLREAAQMWRTVGDAVGVAARDSLWDYPDLVPGSTEIDNPTEVIERLNARSRGETPERDAWDEDLDALLSGAWEEKPDAEEDSTPAAD